MINYRIASLNQFEYGTYCFFNPKKTYFSLIDLGFNVELPKKSATENPVMIIRLYEIIKTFNSLIPKVTQNRP